MDELLSRQIPYSAEAEQAVLGSMLIDSRCVADVMTRLRADDFYIAQNKEIFEVISTMFNYSQTIDPVTVLDGMRQHGVYREETSRQYLMELMSITPTAANVMNYAGIVKEKSLLRSIGETAAHISTLVSEGVGDSGEVLEIAEREIYNIRQGRGSAGLESAQVIAGEVWKHLGELAANGGVIPGLPTGVPDLDDVLTGLNKSDLILLASRPGMGKTSFALNIAVNVSQKTDASIAVFSLEMSKEQLVTRLISSLASVNSKKLLTGRLNDDEWKRIAQAAGMLSKTGLLIDDNSMLTVSDINAECRRVQNLGLVIIDYLQLMSTASGTNAESRQQTVSEMSRMLKIMAKELNVPVICCCQLSRASAQRTEKRPILSDLRESGSLEQDADIVLGLYREDYFNREAESHNVAECIVLKNRHGNTGTVKLLWEPEFTRFQALDTTHEEESY